MVCSPGQRIGLAVSRSLTIDDGVGVGRERSRPPGMPSRRSASSAEVFQVFMIRVDFDRCSSSFQVDPPLLARLDDRQQLLIVDRVVELGRTELPRVVADRVQLAIRVGLGQDASQGEVGRVRLHSDG